MERVILKFPCSRCGFVEVPVLKDVEKAGILNKRKNIKTLRTIKFIHETYELDLVSSKSLIHQISNKKGKCLVCKISDIEGENQNCPNCGRFTLNWDIEKLTKKETMEHKNKPENYVIIGYFFNFVKSESIQFRLCHQKN